MQMQMSTPTVYEIKQDPQIWTSGTEDICCHHCTEQFEGPAFSYPIRREPTGKWVVRGVFCSPACSKRFVVGMGFASFKLLTLLEDMFSEVYQVSNVRPAPDRLVLSKFTKGGVSIGEFRSMNVFKSSSEICPNFIFEAEFMCTVPPCYESDAKMNLGYFAVEGESSNSTSSMAATSSMSDI
jgi:hypothetical protein